MIWKKAGIAPNADSYCAWKLEIHCISHTFWGTGVGLCQLVSTSRQWLYLMTRHVVKLLTLITTKTIYNQLVYNFSKTKRFAQTIPQFTSTLVDPDLMP